MDELAYATGVDPVELRMRNDTDVDQASGRPWSGKHLRASATGKAPSASAGTTARCATNPDAAQRLQIGWGMATATYPGRRMPAGCRVTTGADGAVRFASATHEVGTGVRTVMTPVAADATGP